MYTVLLKSMVGTKPSQQHEIMGASFFGGVEGISESILRMLKNMFRTNVIIHQDKYDRKWEGIQGGKLLVFRLRM